MADGRRSNIPTTPQDLAQRLARIRERMRAANFDALFIYSDEYRPGHAMYFTNFRPINVIEESSHAIFLPAEGEPVAFTGTLNAFAARRGSFIKDVRPIPHLEREMECILAGRARPLRRLGLVGENILPLTTFRMLAAALRGTEIVDATQVVTAERQIKTARELEVMARAGEVGDVSLRTAAAYAAIGRTECELVAIGEHATRLEGGEPGSAYLAVTGINMEFPTWRPTDRPAQRGEVVMLDFAPSVEGYCTDVAITIPMPGCSVEQERVIALAWRVSAKMMEFLRPGRPAKEVFDQTLKLVERAGYARYFLPYTEGTRAIGHGVGLDVVEPPDLGPDSAYDLEPGMVFGIKFDLHGFPWGGVRAEHTVVVTPTGPRAVTCPLSDACPAKHECAFFRPGGTRVDIPWEHLRRSTDGSA